MDSEGIFMAIIGYAMCVFIGYMIGKKRTFNNLIDTVKKAKNQLPSRYSFVIECIKMKLEDEVKWLL